MDVASGKLLEPRLHENKIHIIPIGVKTDIYFRWLAFYKNQTIPYLLIPSTDEDAVVTPFLITAVILKAIQVAHLIYSQVVVDVFFIDWEQPKGVSKGKPEPVLFEHHSKRLHKSIRRITTTISCCHIFGVCII